jgi:pilus assembly protein CpaB
MNKRFLLALAASALFGLIAILILQKILRDRVEIARTDRGTQIVYAITKIPAGTVIAPNQVKLVSHETQLDGAILNMQDVIGKIAQVDLDANLPVRTHFIAGEKDNRRLIPKEGYRAVSIRVDEATSVAGFATPGSIVDVGAVIAPGSNAKPVSKIIVQSLRVLANGQQTQVKTDGTGRIGSTVTLEVTSAQAAMLMLAQREGTLYLTLRHPADQVPEAIPAVVLPQFEEGYKNNTRTAAVPPTPQPTPWIYPTPPPTPTPTPGPTQKMAPVRVISGDKVEVVQVRQ